MIKHLEVAQLRAGMYLRALDGPWMENPFWRSSFRLSESDVGKLRKSRIGHAWIDTDRGADVEDDMPEGAPLPVPFDTATAFSVKDWQEAPVNQPPDFAESEMVAQPDVFEIDLRRASELCINVKAVMKRVFEAARLGRAVQPGECSKVVEELVDQVMDDPAALIVMALLKNHDDYTYTHSVAVCALMVALGKTLGYGRDQLVHLGLAGLMHDIGKAFVPVTLLAKPSSLTADEYRLVKTHTQRGHKLLSETLSSTHPMVLDVCLHHHERVDGHGYPDGLTGDDISLPAKMAAVCDVYDALTSERAYKRKMEPGAALRAMAEAKGHFDQSVFHAFVKTVGIYPVGTLVRLRSEMLAVVVAQDKVSLLHPELRVFYSLRDQKPVTPWRMSLASSPEESIVDIEAASEMDMDLSLVQHLWAPSDVMRI